jgi:hypothetical protein
MNPRSGSRFLPEWHFLQSLDFFRRERQYLDGLPFVQFLKPNSRTILEFHSIPIRRRICRQLPENYGLCGRETVMPLESRRNSRKQELSSIGNADGALLRVDRKESLKSCHPRPGSFDVLNGLG